MESRLLEGSDVVLKPLSNAYTGRAAGFPPMSISRAVALACAFFIISFVFVSCGKPVRAVSSVEEAGNGAERIRGFTPQEGDVVLRMGDGIASDFIVLAFGGKRKISHCGIIINVDGKPFVVHTISGALSDIDGVRIESLDSFVRIARKGSFMAVRSIHADAVRVVAECRRFLDEKRPFDDEFILGEGASLYCTELVYEAFRLAGFPEGFTTVPSISGPVMGFDAFFDPLYFTVVFSE